MDADDVRERLAAACDAAGSLRRWAETHGFSAAFVSAVLNGRCHPSDRLCTELGLERYVAFRPFPKPPKRRVA